MNHNHTNQLIHEKSPYLLQHAHNPVDWLPWGEAAFERARLEDKPIFLSIGYSTCHWCHVMERESFEDEEIAALMNVHFINIKVDREERPDIDRVYMTFVQATTGSGGWPMSVFLTPELKPFYGGTYFPPTDAYGRVGFPALLNSIAEHWRDDRAGIESSGTNVMEALQRYSVVETSTDATDWYEILKNCYLQFARSYDREWGGFGDPPKFPRPVAHDFLHRYYATRGEGNAVQISGLTLMAMAKGGMNDQLGGGFHRYSVDEQWIVSHFEKMLYDQGQLVNSYLEIYQMTRDELFAATARSTLDYVLRDMTHAGGGFFAAEDADSLESHHSDHKAEGAFYVWTTDEIEAALGVDNAAIFNAFYNIRAEGNAPSHGDPHGEFQGKNILHRTAKMEEVAQQFERSAGEIESILSEGRLQLFQLREKRPRPHRDEKVIVAWNGLMISAFARAAQVLDDPRYLEAARRAAHFIRDELYDADRQLLKRHYMNGAADVGGFADDYAMLVAGLLDLFEASFDVEYLKWAEQLADAMNREFWDEADGGYFNAPADPHVLLRIKEDYDGAEPSANSIATMNNFRLAALLERDDLRELANRTLEVFSGRMQQAPYAMPALLAAQMFGAAAPLHIVVAGEPGATDTQALLRAVHEQFVPGKVVLLADGGVGQEYLASRLPFIAGIGKVDGKAAAYVCHDFACRQPVSSADELARLLEG